MVGMNRFRPAAFCRMKSVGSPGSMIAPQDVHATDRACCKARSSTAAPQFAQLNPRVFGAVPTPVAAPAPSSGRTLRSASSSYSTKRPVKKSGGSSL